MNSVSNFAMQSFTNGNTKLSVNSRTNRDKCNKDGNTIYPDVTDDCSLEGSILYTSDKTVTLPPIGRDSPKCAVNAVTEDATIVDLTSRGSDSPVVLSRHNSRQEINSPALRSRSNSRQDIDLSIGLANTHINSHSPLGLVGQRKGSLSQTSTPNNSPRIPRRSLERAYSNGSFEIVYRKPNHLLLQNTTSKIDSGLIRRNRDGSPASSPRILRRNQDLKSVISSERLNKQLQRSSSFSGLTQKGNRKPNLLSHTFNHESNMQHNISGPDSTSISTPPIDDYLVSTMNLHEQSEIVPNEPEAAELDIHTFNKCHDWLIGVEEAGQSMSLDDVALPPVQWKEH